MALPLLCPVLPLFCPRGNSSEASNPCQLNEQSICGVHNVSKGWPHRAIIDFATPALSSSVPNWAPISLRCTVPYRLRPSSAATTACIKLLTPAAFAAD
jgi:hypothetical protein